MGEMPRDRRPALLRAAALSLFAVVVVYYALLAALVDREPYDLLTYRLAARQIVPDALFANRYVDSLPWAYPPSGALMLSPLSWPPTVVAALILLGMSLACIWISCWLVIRASARHLPRDMIAVTALATTATALSFPALQTLRLGQVAALLMAASTVALLGKPTGWRAALLGSAVALKLTPALFVVHAWATGARRLAVRATLWFLAWTLVGFLIMPESTRAYLQGAILDTDRPDDGLLFNYSLFGGLAKMGAFGALNPVSLASVVALTAAAMAAAVFAHRRGWVGPAVCLVGMWTALAAPIGWGHAFIWLVPLAVSVGLAGGQRRDWVVAGSVLALTLLNVSSPLGHWALVHGLYALVGLVLTVWVLVRARQSPIPHRMSRPGSESSSPESSAVEPSTGSATPVGAGVPILQGAAE